MSGKGDGDCAVEEHHRGRVDHGQPVVERHDLVPGTTLDVRRGDSSLQDVGTRLTQRDRAVEDPQAFLDALRAPERAILVLEQDELAGRPHAGRATRVLQEHERQKPEDLGLVRHEHGEELPEADRLVAEVRPYVLATGRRRVALVEDEIEHGENRAQALREQMVGWHAERDSRGADLPLRPHETLGHRRLGREERVGDLDGRQAADLSQRERDAGSPARAPDGST